MEIFQQRLVSESVRSQDRQLWSSSTWLHVEEQQPTVLVRASYAYDLLAMFATPLRSQEAAGPSSTSVQVVFAYGQTSSGKSYSMGTSEVSEFIPIDDPLSDLDERVGIIPRAAQQICAALSSLDDDAVECKLSVSFLELYNEELIDLLSDPDEERAPVQIRETRTGDIVWMGLRQHTVHNAQDMVRLLQDESALARSVFDRWENQSGKKLDVSAYTTFWDSHTFRPCTTFSESVPYSPSNANAATDAHACRPCASNACSTCPRRSYCYYNE
ncbi:unnamed protein product [Malassezia sympodialis ATCC 42132]|uniref:uncharacterized protein n=1 Tax=Malassezia sympodialis (strain ATCC 42132) TaxID=1230383 RepID=UPI0002C1D2A8|nr:uncharacterized protein MSY001_0378 [Malassezia sympodialis ATCC 42132]CCU97672.1 unnamed protein product [Malassezia sympodialis ATCC 42132]|eukprot:XP_018739012.1 uncharacterized protein MSY001_0378 [Malassezia sympodialis ATCC 42132]